METTRRLYVGNLPYAAQKDDIEDLFSNNGITMYVRGLFSKRETTDEVATRTLTYPPTLSLDEILRTASWTPAHLKMRKMLWSRCKVKTSSVDPSNLTSMPRRSGNRPRTAAASSSIAGTAPMRRILSLEPTVAGRPTLVGWRSASAPYTRTAQGQRTYP